MIRRILITGANSYLGTSLEAYLKQWPQEYAVDTVDMIDGSWRDKDFGGYQTVYHVAGIAHSDFGKIAGDREALYRRVNTDLAIETAAKAKADGVKQFIFMSTIVVYGRSADIGRQKVITRETPPEPDNIYGQTKLKAEEGLKALEDDGFKLCILRPPMIYGQGSKGNYQKLAKLAQHIRILPYVSNQRSMLYIGNLCELIRLVIEERYSGVFFPQNREYVDTCDMIREIAIVHHHRIKFVWGFEWLYRIAGLFSGSIAKAFGSLTYDQRLSEFSLQYTVFSFRESILLTEQSSKLLPADYPSKKDSI